MATCKERILKNLIAGKTMTISDMTRTLNHGLSTVKSALLVLKREGYIKIVEYRRAYNTTTPMHVWGWTGKQDVFQARKPKPRSSTRRIPELLSQRGQMTITQLVIESGYSETMTRRAIRELRDEGKVRIADWRAQRGASTALYALSNGEPDAVLVKGLLKIERRRQALEDPQRIVITPRRDPAAAWF